MLNHISKTQEDMDILLSVCKKQVSMSFKNDKEIEKRNYHVKLVELCCYKRFNTDDRNYFYKLEF